MCVCVCVCVCVCMCKYINLLKEALKDYRGTTSKSTVLDTKQNLIVKKRYQENLIEIFYIVANSSTLSLDSDPQTIGIIMKNL